MSERVLAGVPASPGTAFGPVRRLDAVGEIDGIVLDDGSSSGRGCSAPATRWRESARELEELATRLRADGRNDEADILDAGMMMAEDPMLLDAVEARGARSRAHRRERDPRRGGGCRGAA